MKLICEVASGAAPQIVRATPGRDWSGALDRAPRSAGVVGWFVLNSAPLVAQWDGGEAAASIRIESEEVEAAAVRTHSRLGHGVLSFEINGVFRTEAGSDLWIAGPVNRIKDGVQPLTQVLAADAGGVVLTMHWRFTRRRAPVAFEIDEPIGMIFPVPRGLLDDVQLDMRRRDAGAQESIASDLAVAEKPA